VFVVEHRNTLGQSDVANVQAVTDRDVGDIDVDVVGDSGRIEAEMRLVHDLLENAARVSNAFRDADEAERNADSHLFTGDELLEIDVEHLPLEWMPLDLADQRARHFAVDGQLDNSARRVHRAEELVEVAGIEGKR